MIDPNGPHWDERMFPWDRETPRFYPPGQHPAVAREREWLAKARGFRAELVRAIETDIRPRRIMVRGIVPVIEPSDYLDGIREIDELIVYLEDRLASFEARESELKAEAYLRYR